MRYFQEISDSETKAKVTCLPTVAVAVTAAGKERESGFESADTEAVAQIARGGIMFGIANTPLQGVWTNWPSI